MSNDSPIRDVYDRSTRERTTIEFVTCDFDDRPHERDADDRPCRDPRPVGYCCEEHDPSPTMSPEERAAHFCPNCGAYPESGDSGVAK